MVVKTHCIHFRNVNSVTKTDVFPIPGIDNCIVKITQTKYVTKFDLVKGFWQIPLLESAKDISFLSHPTPD